MKLFVGSTLLVCSAGLMLAAAQPGPTIDVEDFVETPMTGLTDGKGTNDVLLSRVNTIREEAGGACCRRDSPRASARCCRRTGSRRFRAIRPRCVRSLAICS